MRMNRFLIIIIQLALIGGCKNNVTQESFTKTAERISIFEVYFKQPEAVDAFGGFLRDTLQLPVEWEPFDIFGNGLVYDAAYYLGNTTLELLSLSAGDSILDVPARFNRVLFDSKNIEETSQFLQRKGLEHNPPFDFIISSAESELQIGRQINLDSLSEHSNVFIAFWQYENAGFNFSERSYSANNSQKLNEKLDEAFEMNPLGIMGLKEIHLTITKTAQEQWIELLGEPQQRMWNLKEGPSISYELNEKSIGLDWISLKVRELNGAKEFLIDKQISYTLLENGIQLDRSIVYGLSILLEE